MDSRTDSSIDKWVDEQLALMRAAPGWQPDAGRALDRFRARHNAVQRRRAKARWSAAVAVGVLAPTLITPQGNAFAQRCAEACVQGTDTVAQFVQSRIFGDPAVESQRPLAPDFALPDQNGRIVRLSSLRGRVVLLNFWATWCNPCRTEIPWFIDLQNRYASRGLSVIGISLDEDDWKAVRPFIDQAGIDYPVAVGDEAITRLYDGLDSIPATLLVDRTGRIARTHVGLVSSETYETELLALLNQR